MAVNLSPVGGVAAQFFDNSGNVLTGGKLFTYLAGTTTPQPSYTTAAGNIAWSNPILLDAAGRVSGSGEIWLTDGIQYKFILRDSNDVLIATYDNINGINSNFVNFTNQQEIQIATAGQTVFNLNTVQYQPGTNSLSVFVDGVNQYGPGAQYAYLETDADTVTFTNGLHVGAEVKFTTSQLNSSSAGDASQVSYNPPFINSVPTNVEAKLAQYVNVIDFGAVGDYDPNTNTGTDDTVAIQNAIDYGFANQKSIYIPSGNYLVSNLIVYATTCLVGTGRHTTNLFVKDGTTGAIIWDNDNSALKVILKDFAVYGRSIAGITDIIKLGLGTSPFGTEGVVSGLFLRDAPNAKGMNVLGNVSFFETITVWNCDTSFYILGDANYMSNLVAYAPTTFGLYASNCHVRGIEIEAPADTSIPIYIYRDSYISNVVFSLANNTTIAYLVELDPAVYQWSVENIQYVFGSNPGSISVTSGNFKDVNGSFFGGSASGVQPVIQSFRSAGDFRDGLYVKEQQLQSFTFRIFESSSLIYHRIGAVGQSSTATNNAATINGATNIDTVTPSGANATTPFASGAKINSANTSTIIFDTEAQIPGNFIGSAVITVNTTGTVLTANLFTLSVNVNGVTKERMAVQFLNASSGAGFDLTAIPVGKVIDVNITAYIA